MTMTQPSHRLHPRSQALVDRFDDLTEYDGDVGDAFRSLDISYDAFRKILLRAERDDLAAKLADWKTRDSLRLSYALGVRWNSTGVAK